MISVLQTRYFLLLIFLTAFFRPEPVAARYTSFNYQRSNGFPGNKVYCLFQDKQGYIWMGTENGLVSYNGYEFKTYTTRDGLPDNEVLFLNEDKQGRLWIITFTTEVCYLWKGKICNARNDTLMRRIKPRSVPNSVFFDRWGNTFIAAQQEIIRIDPAGKMQQLKGTFASLNKDGDLIIYNETTIHRYRNNRLEQIAKLPIHPSYHYNHCGFLAFMSEEFSWAPFQRFIDDYYKGFNRYWKGEELTTIVWFRRMSNNQIGVGTRNGIYMKDIFTGNVLAYFLPGQTVSYGLIAKDSSLWLGTLGNGVYHYSRSFIKPVLTGNKPGPVSFIRSTRDELQFISSGNMFTRMPLDTHHNPLRVIRTEMKHLHPKEVYCYVGRNRNGTWTAINNEYLLNQRQPGKGNIRTYNPGYCKAATEEDSTHLLLFSIGGIFRLERERFAITDTFYDRRVTAVAKLKNNIYAGTLSGVLRIGPDKKVHTLFPDHPLLKGRIMALCADRDSVLWIANNKAAIAVVIDGRIVRTIDGTMGLGCNSISTMKMAGRFLWVGTDNGLYAISREYPYRIVRHLSYKDGLSNDQVITLETRQCHIWVGTDQGLDYLDEREVLPLKPQPVFTINSIRNDSAYLSVTDRVMELKSKTLQIDLDIVDHSGIAKPVYAYRLNNGGWIKLPDDNLYFPTIPYGRFTLSLKAMSPNWEEPREIKLRFQRAYPFYLSWWFLIIAIMVLLALVVTVISLLLRRARRKDREKLLVQQQLLQLEQMALQGQMNPHFIFNCITAIRQYYSKGDVQRANRFVDAFAAMIRATFDMASQTFISLDRELNYLNQYLTIEQERFNQSFQFSITKDICVPETQVPVPAMLLQPLVENAVRHGVRHLPDGTGSIDISIVQRDGNVQITVTDNGIGRARTQALKLRNPGLEAATSTSVNRKRVDVLNRLFGNKMIMETCDITGSDGSVQGTSVLIAYPLDIYEHGA